MAKINTPADLLVEELKDLYSAEIQQVKALPALIGAATSSELRRALQSHLMETQIHAERLEKIGKELGSSLKGRKCTGMRGLVAEATEVVGADAEKAMLDLALIGAVQKIEHYEIASYGTARALAEFAGKSGIAAMLQETLHEEGDTDKLLTATAIKVDLNASMAVEANVE